MKENRLGGRDFPAAQSVIVIADFIHMHHHAGTRAYLAIRERACHHFPIRTLTPPFVLLSAFRSL